MKMCCMNERADYYIWLSQWNNCVVWDHMADWPVLLLRNVNSSRMALAVTSTADCLIYFFMIQKRALVFPRHLWTLSLLEKEMKLIISALHIIHYLTP